jgi:cystathionine gamma-synthase
MVTPITTEFGGTMPPASRYSIAVHLPEWKTIDKFIKGDQEVFKQLKTIYPRMAILFGVREVGVS